MNNVVLWQDGKLQFVIRPESETEKLMVKMFIDFECRIKIEKERETAEGCIVITRLVG